MFWRRIVALWVFSRQSFSFDLQYSLIGCLSVDCRLSIVESCRGGGIALLLAFFFLCLWVDNFFRYCENFHAMRLWLVTNLYNWFDGVVCVFY